MKYSTFFLLITFLISCSDNGAEQAPQTDRTEAVTDTTQPVSNSGKPELVGSWKQKHTYFDRNNDNLLQEEEKVPAQQMLGYDYFEFKADGSCWRDSDMKFRGTYQVSETGGNQQLKIFSEPPGDNFSYTIKIITANELLLFSNGVFLLFERQ